ncbi:tripartite tricarboxylate transporter substrate binding protein [Alcaligenaceae bacterium]|nr:tripartite tricarboxylate transporter substrate binding protein [Alcaligenaceae bacterium]
MFRSHESINLQQAGRMRARSGPGRMLGNMLRRIAVAAGSLMMLCAANVAAADNYPDANRAIKLVVPTGAGSALDLLARAYGQAMANVASLNVVVENRPGAEGVIGIRTVLNEPANGYTMTLLSSSMLALNPIMIPKLSYDPLKDLEPIITLSTAGLVMSLGTSTKFETLSEFIKDAKANPGKYTCATSSSTLRMACEFLQASAGIELLLVPYKTTAEAMAGIASGDLDVIFVDAGSSLVMWQSGRMRPVGVATEERLASLPDVPTMKEEGLPEFLMTAWYATFFRTGTPESVTKAMQEIMVKASEDPGVKAALATFVHEPLLLVGEDVRTKNREEIELWTNLVRENNIKIGQ